MLWVIEVICTHAPTERYRSLKRGHHPVLVTLVATGDPKSSPGCGSVWGDGSPKVTSPDTNDVKKKGPGPCALFFLAQTFGPSLDVFLATLVTTRLSMSTGWASPWFFRFITPLNLQVVVLVGQEIIMPILQVMIITLWLFNIAMGNGP